jgi:hypothetical protein
MKIDAARQHFVNPRTSTAMKNFFADFRISVSFQTDRQTDRDRRVKEDSDINRRLSRMWIVTQNCQVS